MKKTNLLILLLSSAFSFGQVGINNPSPKATLDITGKTSDGTAAEGLILPKITGNALFAAIASNVYGAAQNGTVIFVTAPADQTNQVGQTVRVDAIGYYYFDSTTNEWWKMGGGNNFYNSDGTLTDTRNVTMNGNNLGFMGGRIAMGTTSPDPSAILDLTSLTLGFLPPRMTEVEMNAIQNPAKGLIIYCTDCFAANLGCVMVNDSSDPLVPNWGSLCSSNVPSGHVLDIECVNASTSGAVHSGVAVSGVTVTVPYIGGNGGTYPSAAFTSTGVTGLTASLMGGALASGNGSFMLAITGTPSAAGTATFNITIAGKTCAFTVDVDNFTADVSSLDCGTAVFAPATLHQGEAYTGTLTVAYTGGNGDAYPQLSFTQNGLTFTLPAGTLATGNGNLVYNVTGTPAAAIAMTIPITFGSQSCNVNKTVMNDQDGTVVMCGSTKAWSLYNIGADTSANPYIPVKELHGNYYQWGTNIVVADADTPAGNIIGWNPSLNQPDSSWNSGTEASPVKTANDPCPTGFRIPTRAEYNTLMNNNSLGQIGSYGSNATNYGFARTYTCGGKMIIFPAAGMRHVSGGSLYMRGALGFYWTSTENISNAYSMVFDTPPSVVLTGYSRAYAQSVRCVAE
ncbi:FISUMP domain-containing protein [Chryseobacterium potabilaquae]|uniref:Uncharacterized protein n=1 Tax=Chryseobacterium potabilaquae TaxID=2675057 RepID=A0A6N4X213_9FLAO|nr:FISUMP domain-containing protein [Chryseobacterium potabilaquae]CAA7194337.1 hypothetical protein CHRY9293_00669 [Chryseobacterium potabilaquae]